MSNPIRNIFSIPELKKRVLFTLGMLAVFRIGGHIPTPGINGKALAAFFKQVQGSFLGLVDLFSGGNLSQMTIFALGVMPYISAAIIMELLVVVSPYIERLSKEGEYGRKKITEYTRYGTVLICVIQSLGIATMLESMSAGGMKVVMFPGWGFRVLTVLTLTTGSVFLMWLGEQITEKGIGNGISLLIFAGIIKRFPAQFKRVYQQVVDGEVSVISLILFVALLIVIMGVVVYVERAYRRIPIQYAKRVVGRRVYGGQSTHLPIKVNTGGVIPIIFASSIVTIPTAFQGLANKYKWFGEIARQLSWGMPLYNLLYFVGIIFFTYFYVSIIFNPQDVADNVRKYGGFIPGIRPGKPTADYIDRVLSRLTFVGALYLALVAIIPEFMIFGFKVGALPWIGPSLERIMPDWVVSGLGIQFFFGGTSLLIVVGVAMDTLQQIEAQLVMRNYDGFIKGVRVRGRR